MRGAPLRQVVLLGAELNAEIEHQTAQDLPSAATSPLLGRITPASTSHVCFAPTVVVSDVFRPLPQLTASRLWLRRRITKLSQLAWPLALNGTALIPPDRQAT